MTDVLIRATELTRTLPTFKLGPISFELEPGLVYALVGPNGSGKTTLFRMLMGLVRPDSGRIDRLGTPIAVDDPTQTRRIAYVPETLNGHDVWRTQEINELYSRIYPQFDLRQVQQLQTGVDLYKPFSELSKGQQRRAMLGVALASQPDVLLCDEPTDGIDPFARQEVLAHFAEFMENENRTVLLATHNLEDVRRVADVVIVLEQGEHIGTWQKDELLEGWQRVWLATEPSRPLQGEVERILHGGVQIVTSDLAATRADTDALGIEIVSMQTVDMVESLRIVINARRGRASPFSRSQT